MKKMYGLKFTEWARRGHNAHRPYKGGYNHHIRNNIKKEIKQILNKEKSPIEGF